MAHHNSMNMTKLYPIITEALLEQPAARQKLLDQLPALLKRDDVAALRLPVAKAPFPPFLNALITLCHESGTALMAMPLPPERARSLPLNAKSAGQQRLDGLHASSLGAWQALPRFTGHDAPQTGCCCASLDEAMQAGEAGADYVSFQATEVAFFTLWNAMAELPAVAECGGTPESWPDMARQAAMAGADFVAFPLPVTDDGTLDSAAIDALGAAVLEGSAHHLAGEGA
ncbi:hypothetical protein E3E12_01330 [Formicincola oecophyllae]|uniref:Thiamine phosphate synthase n=1 Tax=Formicincola oecophyllae TaxID=2558361 RepID=A0A4Y6U9M7_9PROT|nr:hypothetical protein [Formicincola oecophyllae]QDH13061.1 hypothetical protein E3E12_01330 [Formicincola oecophyllae]